MSFSSVLWYILLMAVINVSIDLDVVKVFEIAVHQNTSNCAFHTKSGLYRLAMAFCMLTFFVMVCSSWPLRQTAVFHCRYWIFLLGLSHSCIRKINLKIKNFI